MNLVDDSNNRGLFTFRFRGEDTVASLSPVLFQIILNVIVGKSDGFLPERSNRTEEYDRKGQEGDWAPELLCRRDKSTLPGTLPDFLTNFTICEKVTPREPPGKRLAGANAG